MEYIVDIDGLRHTQTIGKKLVRCEDCKFGYQLDKTYIHCTKPYSRANHVMDFYCADGEQREGGHE